MDIELLRFANQALVHPVLDAFFAFVTIVGDPTYHVVLLLPALLIKRWRRYTVPLWLCYALTMVLTMAFQFGVARPRPDPATVRLILPQPNFFSYPSGHTSTAVAAAAVLGMLARRQWVWLIGGLWAVSVALSRLYLGHHYPSDVFGGTLLGLGCGAASFGLFAKRTPEKSILLHRLGWLLWLQIGIALLATHMAYLDILPWRLLSWPFADKVLHAVLIGGIAFWLNLVLRGRELRLWRFAVPLAIVLPFGIALLEEVAQTASTVRTFDLTDLAADLIGLVVAWWLSKTILQRSQARINALCV